MGKYIDEFLFGVDEIGKSFEFVDDYFGVNEFSYWKKILFGYI